MVPIKAPADVICLGQIPSEKSYLVVGEYHIIARVVDTTFA